jgi:RNA binding exosome subunit
MSDTPEVKSYKEALIKCFETNIRMMSLMQDLYDMSDEDQEAAYDETEKLGDEIDGLEIELDKQYAALERVKAKT